MMSKSVSVITRAYDAEAPYIRSFLDYYTGIGCAEFHIVVPPGNPFSLLEAQCKNYTNIKWYTDNADVPLRGSQSIPLKHITTSHLISVDVDEYLDIPDINLFTQYDYVRLNWTIVPWCSISGLKSIPGFADKQCKYLVRSDICVSMDDHDCQTNIKVTQHVSEYALLHYVYRSFNDLYLKCALSNYGDYQSKNNAALSAVPASIKDLPHKFKMAAIYQQLANASTAQFQNLVKIDLAVEAELLSRLPFADMKGQFELAFVRYSSRIDLSKFTAGVLSHANFKKYRRLPHHVLADIADETLMDKLSPDWCSAPPKGFNFFRK